MEFQSHAAYNSGGIFNEFPDDQPPATSYPQPGEMAPLNPRPYVPGTDAPEVNTGRMEPDAEQEETNEDEDQEEADEEEITQAS